MPRLLALLIGLTGLFSAAYLVLHPTTSVVPTLGKLIACDSTLFGIAIAAVSIGVLLASRQHYDPDAGDTLRM